MARATLPAVAVLAVMTILAAACGDDDESSGDPSASPQSSDISLDSDSVVFSIVVPAGDVSSGFPYVVTSGDFNSDGVADVLLGTPQADGPQDARVDAGEAYVLFGPLEGEIDLAQTTPDVHILGAVMGDFLGSGVAAGDLNNDGTDDIVVGASASDAIEKIRTDMGEAYVIFGGENLAGEIDLLNQEQDFTLQPAEGFAQVGRAFAVGDVNGDGIDDLVAGAPYGGRAPNTPVGAPRTTVGEVYVVFGGLDFGGLVSVARGEEDLRLAGLRELDQFGGSVALADANRDGTRDIVVGANGYDGPAQDRDAAGAVFVFEGGPVQPPLRTASEADIAVFGAAAESLGTHLAVTSETVISASAPSAGTPDAPSSGFIYSVDVAGLSGQQLDLATCNCATAVDGARTGGLFPASLINVAASLSAGRGSGSGEATPVEARDVYVLPVPEQDTVLVGDLTGVTRVLEAVGDGLATADLEGDGGQDLLILSAGPEPRLYGVRLSR